MEKIRLTRSFTFDMAHALPGYDGPCRNIHGHTYRLSVSLLGTPLLEPGHPKDGMVFDFAVLKKTVEQSILSSFDHALVLNHNSSLSDSKEIKDECEKFIVLPFQPTCENLLSYFVSLLRQEFKSGPELISARLDETTNAFAEWYLSDNQD